MLRIAEIGRLSSGRALITRSIDADAWRGINNTAHLFF